MSLVYLVRHAHALDLPDDALRPLSPRGQREIAHVADLLRPAGAFHPAEIWHSPLLRAKQTAERLAAALKLEPRWVERADLQPEEDPAHVAAALAHARHGVAVVGHEPHLSALATLLVTGDAEPVVFTMQKATVLALEPIGRRFAVRWQISPDLFPHGS